MERCRFLLYTEGMSNKILYIVIGVAVLIGLVAALSGRFIPVAEGPMATSTPVATSTDGGVVCTKDAMQCPDGSYVGRTGPNCEFVCPNPPEVPKDIQDQIDAKANLIKVSMPVPYGLMESPQTIRGQARGNWFFEASAPVTLVNWDGLIIADGFVTADGEWMTTDFVSFTGTLEFISPYKQGDPDFMKRGTLIFKKDNPSGLPENDDALEIPIVFEQTSA